MVRSGLETEHGEQQMGPGPLSGTVVLLFQPVHVHESMTTMTCYSLKVLGCSVAQEISLQGLDSLVQCMASTAGHRQRCWQLRGVCGLFSLQCHFCSELVRLSNAARPVSESVLPDS